jgi:hypothetical protein
MSIAALNWALKTPVGSQSARHILLLLANYADERGSCFPSQATLAEQAEMSTRSVQTAIALLEEKGVLTRMRDRKANGHLGITRFVLAVDGPLEKDSTAGDSALVDGSPPEEFSAGDHRKDSTPPPENSDVATGKIFRSEPPTNPQPEPERVRARGDSEAGAVERSLTDLLVAWGARSSGEDIAKVRRVLAAMPAAERDEAVAGVGPFLEFHKSTGRRNVPWLHDWLSERAWRHVALAANATAALKRAAAAPAGRPVVLGRFKRAWWVLVWRRYAAGPAARGRLRFVAELANGGSGFPVNKPEDEVSADQEAAMLQVETKSPAAEAALARLSAAGFHLRIDITVPYVWIPAESPAAAAGGVNAA